MGTAQARRIAFTHHRNENARLESRKNRKYVIRNETIRANANLLQSHPSSRS